MKLSRFTKNWLICFALSLICLVIAWLPGSQSENIRTFFAILAFVPALIFSWNHADDTDGKSGRED